MNTHRNAIAMALLHGIAAVSAAAGPARPAFERLRYSVDSGIHENQTEQTVVTFSTLLQVPSAPWMRVRIADYNLGEQSYISLMSTLDGGWQRLDARSLPQWRNASAVFNGSDVELELHVAPGESGIFVRVESVVAGDRADGPPTPPQGQIASLCGADDRSIASDDAVGRIWFNFSAGTLPGGCTAWLAANGALLTAGHCVDGDPDQGGPGTPSGGVDPEFLGAIIEFDPPSTSLSNGVPRAARPDDQYAVDRVMNYRFAGLTEDMNSIGADWAVFSVVPNSNTQLTPHRAQHEFHRVAAVVPIDDITISVTGYGLDFTPAGSGDGRCLGGSNDNAACTSDSQCASGNCVMAPGCDGDQDGTPDFNCNNDNLTLQTASGPYNEYATDGAKRWHEYEVDTTGATSGSPVIIRTSTHDYVIGINTNSGCSDAFEADENYGTAFTVFSLHAALDNFLGSNVVHVDRGYGPCFGACNGSISAPFPNVSDGVLSVGDGGIVAITPGGYSAASGNTFTLGADGRSMTLMAPVGIVTIGH